MIYYIRKQPRHAAYAYCVVSAGTVHHCQSLQEAEAYGKNLEDRGYKKVSEPINPERQEGGEPMK